MGGFLLRFPYNHSSTGVHRQICGQESSKIRSEDWVLKADVESLSEAVARSELVGVISRERGEECFVVPYSWVFVELVCGWEPFGQICASQILVVGCPRRTMLRSSPNEKSCP